MRTRKNKLVEWQDHGSEQTWVAPEDLKEWANKQLREFKADISNKSKGDVVLETKHYIVVASEYDSEGNIGNRTIIFKHPPIRISNLR